MIVARFTCQASAASAIVASWRTSWRKISYFCDGLKKRLARRPARSVPRSGSGMVTSSSTGREDLRMLTDRSADLYRELRRKPRASLSGASTTLSNSAES
jgi:hypothetical protein